MSDKIVKVNQETDRANPISVIRKELTIGEKTVLAFMDATGKYYLNFAQIEELLELYSKSFVDFLARAGHLSSGAGLRENAGFKTNKELRSAWAKGLISGRGVHYVQTETGAKYRAAELDLVTDFILDQAYKGNQLAQTLNKALTKESLQIRCESAFVGVSPNIDEIIRINNNWLTARGMSKSVHAAFANHCKAKHINGSQIHELMTSNIFGQTKKMAIASNQLIGEDPTVGLDYQADELGLLVLTRAKVAFCGYSKGTPTERAERAVDLAMKEIIN